VKGWRESMRPRRLGGASGRPLNFTVRRHSKRQRTSGRLWCFRRGSGLSTSAGGSGHDQSYRLDLSDLQG
jgi:hypothetical protein